MSLPRFPIRDSLRDPAQSPGADRALDRIWQNVDARFPRRPRPQRSRVFLWSAATALGVAGLVLFLVGRRADGPLRLADGQALVAVDAPAGGLSLPLSDGSRIELGGGARLEPFESSGTSFVAVLAKGSAAFDVRPGGPRRWRIECGLATVEVLGTRFSCERTPGKLRVGVQRGVVLVSGERVPDRVRRLAALEALEVLGPAANTETVAPVRADPAVAPGPANAPELLQPPAPAFRAPGRRGPVPGAWRDLARGGRHAEAFAALGQEGVRREVKRVGVADLFALADVARLSGHPAEAERPLQRILNEFASDPQASLAAFALGRLELDSLGRPHKAAAALNRALALGIPQGLREDVRARLVEAYLQAGDREAARNAADAYHREFPNGRHAKAINARLPRD